MVLVWESVFHAAEPRVQGKPMSKIVWSPQASSGMMSPSPGPGEISGRNPWTRGNALCKALPLPRLPVFTPSRAGGGKVPFPAAHSALGTIRLVFVRLACENLTIGEPLSFLLPRGSGLSWVPVLFSASGCWSRFSRLVTRLLYYLAKGVK